MVVEAEENLQRRVKAEGKHKRVNNINWQLYSGDMQGKRKKKGGGHEIFSEQSLHSLHSIGGSGVSPAWRGMAALGRAAAMEWYTGTA